MRNISFVLINLLGLTALAQETERKQIDLITAHAWILDSVISSDNGYNEYLYMYYSSRVFNFDRNGTYTLATKGTSEKIVKSGRWKFTENERAITLDEMSIDRESFEVRSIESSLLTLVVRDGTASAVLLWRTQ